MSAVRDTRVAPAAPREELRALAACPICLARLSWTGNVPVCESCGLSYPIEDGVLILVSPDRPRDESERWYPGMGDRVPRQLRHLAHWYARHTPTLTYKSADNAHLIPRFVALLGPDSLILNVGSGMTFYGPNVINLDVTAQRGVHVVGTAERLPFATASFDGLILQAVLEHVQSSRMTLSEIHRVLKPEGRLFVEVPFVQGYHSTPGSGDYRRYTEQGLRAELEESGFEIDASGTVVGPASGMSWITAEFLALLFSGRSARAYRVLRALTPWLAAPVKFADSWLERHPMGYVICSGPWAQARRIGDTS